MAFLHPLPLDAVWGVGERTGEVLGRLGLRTVADLANAPVGMLRKALGEAAAHHLHELAWARDDRRVSPSRVEKSVSAETTFDVDVADPVVVRRTLLALSTRVGARLRQAGHTGRTVAIKVRLADFRTLSRSRTLPVPTDVAREIFDAAWQLFQVLHQALSAGEQIRLVGVRAEGLATGADVARQLTLGEREQGWREAERAVDAVAARFGGAVVAPASLLRPGSEPAPGPSAAPMPRTGAADQRGGRSADPHTRLPRRGITMPAMPAWPDNSTGVAGSAIGVTTEVAERDFDPLSDPLCPS